MQILAPAVGSKVELHASRHLALPEVVRDDPDDDTEPANRALPVGMGEARSFMAPVEPVVWQAPSRRATGAMATGKVYRVRIGVFRKTILDCNRTS